MKITEEAKELLLEALKANDASCILVKETKSCCGTQLNFSLAKPKEGDAVESIEGVPFMIDVSVKRKTEKLTVKAENGQLFIRNENVAEETC